MIPLAIGWLVLKRIRPLKENFYFLEEIFLAFGLGFGLITLVMFYFSLLSIACIPLNISLASLIPFAILSAVNARKTLQTDSVVLKAKSKYSFWELLLIFMILFNMAMVAFRAYFQTIDIWDRWAVWAFKAKVYFVHQRIPFERFSEFVRVWGNWDYPNHVPLMEAWVALNLGYWNDQLTRLVFPLFFIGISVCVFCLCCRSIPRPWSLMATFCLSSLPLLQDLTIGALTEPVLAFYYLFSLALLLRWMHTEDKVLLILSAVFGGLTAWTKNEGMVYVLFNWFTLMLFLHKNRNNYPCKVITKLLGFYALIVLAVILPHLIFKTLFGLKNVLINVNNISLPLILQNLRGVPDGLEMLFGYLFIFHDFNLLWHVFFIFFIRNLLFRIFVYPDSYILFPLSFYFILIIALRLIDPTELFLTDAMARLLLFPAVLAIPYVFLSAFRAFSLAKFDRQI